ncbi:AAA domain-containing protein [Nocardioides sp. NBC_00163]|uniref:AAA domain-containing protein n=1 Tax=Nocardioides sp. NBC_00163 TaxID=2975999 RepID=UPI003248DD7B
MPQDDEIKAALKAWRDGLVGLTRQSALIKFRAPKTSSLLIDSPDADDVLALLMSSKSQAFRGDVDLDDSNGPRQLPSGVFFHSPRPDGEVGPVVRNLMRRAAAEFLDRGLTVLYVAFGMLDWRDVDETAMVSPVLLVPVQLLPEGPKGTPRITVGEDDPVINPALALRLREFGIELPTAQDIEGLTVSETLAEVRAALTTSKTFVGWTLRDAVYLATFSFAKEAMFKDLADNEATILDHPVVRALATSDPMQQSREFQFDPIDPEDIDRLAPPEATPLVLDADSSQRTAVAAALAGKTFVMDGPPGTGKSQTIANMIGALLHAGKTVLFVSEKIAALDVVRNRLAAAGLGSYLMELHSHKASRKEVATELLKTLDNVARPPVEMPTLARQSLKDRRESLNDYAAAMNEIREPLNKSLHHVLGDYANLVGTPTAPVPEVAPTDLSEGDYLGIQETLAKLVRAWRPAAQGNSFLWRDVVDEQSLEVRLYQAESALEELRGTVALNADLVEVFELTRPSDTPQLIELIEHQHRPHPDRVLERWLTADSIESLVSARAGIGQQIAQLRDAEGAVLQACSRPWTAFPEPGSLPSSPPPVAVSPLAVDLQTSSAADLSATADRFEADARMLGQWVGSLSSLAGNLGLPPVDTFSDIERITRLIDLRSQNTRPDRRWFTPTGLVDARALAAQMREHVVALAAAETKAASVFTPAALHAPLADLQDRFANLHKGLKKLSGNYRMDKRAVAGLLTDAADVKIGITHLADAVEWGDSNQAFQRLAAARGEALGAHWAGRDTDFVSLDLAFRIVEEVLTLTAGEVPAALVTYLTGTESNDAFQTVADAARADIDRWKRELRPAPALSGRLELVLGSIGHAIDWLTAHVQPARRGAARINAVARITGGIHTLAEINDLVELVANAKRGTEEIVAAEATYRAALGDVFKFGETDLDLLDEAIGWAIGLRSIAKGPLTTSQVKALEDSNLVEATWPAYDRWMQASSRIISAFAPQRHRELAAELDDYSGALELTADLRGDTVGQQEWFDYQHAYADLAARGLDTAVDFCIQQRLTEREVPNVVNRALLRGWLDAMIQADARLRPLLAGDRDSLVEEYRTLDRDLLKTATADIVLATNARRPVNTTMGEPGVIRREGSKQRKHKPVRDLMSLTRTVTPSIKPVFMMSPLAVSQYLPSDMTFDVVIFDEASQVTPGDAINCIYRGKALILAGDDKQLPPTSFFERMADDEDEETDVKDFQSVLELAKASGAFNNLGLRWHYRSRHEDLIAYSNYKFYEGKLVTFPSAHAEGDDVGVEFFHAHGTYRRGGGAYNPIEAAKVAERVIEHFANRPTLTLGVVTFSVAQADAVQNAIDEARVDRRDLDRFFDTEDRLDGFFIRALEQVQGDERDVIIFSVGYGPDEAGKVSTGFGALNKEKGWRRLNVGITRARQRVEVVASMHAGQIPPSTNENVEYFRGYLDYAEKGPQTLAVPYSSTGLDPDSPFEESVIATLQGWGYVVEPQVGAAGFRIDIGVRHPAYAGMFAIGIECDGYQYHSAPAARDRDRLRDQILVGLGWRLHRIWGTAWYRDRAIEETRLRAAIEEAIAAPLESRTKRVPPVERPVVETEQADIAALPTWTSSYTVAPARGLPRWVDPGEAGNHLHMVEAIEALVAHETPVHLDVAYERLRAWWNVGRIGVNIRANIDMAIKRAQVVRDGAFLLAPAADVTLVRTPGDGVARKVEQVHLDELAMAAVLTIRDVGAVTRSEAVQGIARVFGWTRTGAIVERRINEAINRLIATDDVLRSDDDTLTLAKPAAGSR